jgi:hypothetical protein
MKNYTDEETPLELEDTNFRIGSTGWRIESDSGLFFKINPESDICEFLGVEDRRLQKIDWEIIGEQLFTWQAAIRETAKEGKRMPSDDEWTVLMQKNVAITNAIDIGYRNHDEFHFGDLAHYWSSTPHSKNMDCLSTYTGKKYIYKANNGFSGLALSVRCLKN